MDVFSIFIANFRLHTFFSYNKRCINIETNSIDVLMCIKRKHCVEGVILYRCKAIIDFAICTTDRSYLYVGERACYTTWDNKPSGSSLTRYFRLYRYSHVCRWIMGLINLWVTSRFYYFSDGGCFWTRCIYERKSKGDRNHSESGTQLY